MVRNKKWEWTEGDDRRLLEMRAAGKSSISIAATLKRTPRAIDGRLSILRKQIAEGLDPVPESPLVFARGFKVLTR